MQRITKLQKEFSYFSRAFCFPLTRVGKTQQSFVPGGSAPRSNPFMNLLYSIFDIKITSFLYLLLTSGTPFTYLVSNFTSVLSAANGCLKNMNKSPNPQKCIRQSYWAFQLSTEITDFPTLLKYTSTRGIFHVKRSPPFQAEPPPPPPPVQPIIVLGCSRCSDNPENGASWKAEPDKAEERKELTPSVPSLLLCP